MKKPRSLSSLKQSAWKLFSQWIRTSNADEGGTVECYTCGKLMFWRESQCGHAIGGRHGAVLFDEEIVRPQCVHCNVFLRGNYPIFTTKLIKEKGMDWWECKLVESRKTKKYTRSDLEELIESLKRKLKP